MTDIDNLLDRVNPYRNTLVIIEYGKIARLHDVIENNDDYFWVFDTKYGLVKSSCLLNWIPLKGFLNDDDYQQLVRVWNLNNTNKVI